MMSDDERSVWVCVGKLKSGKLRHNSCDTANSRFREKSDSKSDKKRQRNGRVQAKRTAQPREFVRAQCCKAALMEKRHAQQPTKIATRKLTLK
jgi:hypothetical protein